MAHLKNREVQSLLGDLSAPQCRQLLDALSKALADYSSSSSSSSTNGPPLVHQPMRQVFTTAAGHTSLFMPASDTRTTGIKIVTLPGHGGAPRGAINVFSPDGALAGLLNAEEITAFRTALATMIPLLRAPLPPNPRVVVFGAGKQAEWHVRLAALLMPLAGGGVVTVVNRSAASLDRLGRRLRAACPGLALRLLAREGRAPAAYEAELRAALRDCDAVMCCTPSTEPLFPAAYLAAEEKKRRRFVSLIGSYKPSMQEVDAETLLSGAGGRVYVDSREACLQEAGEIIRAGVPGDRLVELGEALAADHDFGAGAAEEGEGNVVFKCVGMGIMDVVVAAGLLDIAREKGVGRTIEDF
ncbi:proline utilization protein PrnX [Biscogniauxia mediterranea]|nr:proline utilization protein PrnX [Biscogniauxia mediterranea]